MDINVAICDDERDVAKKVAELTYITLEKKQHQAEIKFYSDGNDILEAVFHKKEKIDILLLDIDMPQISGIEVAKKIHQADLNITLIFVTSHGEFVYDSFEYAPFRYIRKFRLEIELPIALRAACDRVVSLADRHIIIKTEDGDINLEHKEIMYFEMEARKICLYKEDGQTYLLRKTIKALYRELNNPDFVQIHSGCVVNVKYIKGIGHCELTLVNGQRLIVSRTRVKDVTEAISNFWGNKI